MSVDVTAIIATFRRPAQLEEAVRSVLAQEEVAVEVLVLDDSPEGSAREVIAALADPRVRYQKREVPSDGHPTLLRNEGWPQAQGRYISFVDDDDRVAAGGYRALKAPLDANPAAALSFGRVQPFGAAGGQMTHEIAFFLDAAWRARRALWLRSRIYFVSELLFGASLYVSSAVLVRKEFLEAVGGLDPSAGLMDTIDLGVRAARARGCAYVDEVVALHRAQEASLLQDPAHTSRLSEAYEAMQRSYRDRHGALEFIALKAYARTLRRFL